MTRRPRVVLPVLPSGVDEMWHVLMDLGESLGECWTLVGGQMTFLHAMEHGVSPVRPTQDGDVVADVRADQKALGRVVEALTGAGLTLEGISTFGIGHRYVRGTDGPGRVVVDVLAPEGVGDKADLSTAGNARTLEIPAGTQALSRSRMVEVQHGDRVGVVPCPSLLGALIAKSAACGLPGDVTRHLQDVAVLCALIEDPFELKGELTRKDRQRLQLTSVLGHGEHQAWLLLPADLRSRGQFAHQILLA